MFCFENVAAIIFDLDDTLVHSRLDFNAIKRRLGCPSAEDILAYIEQIPCPEQKALAHDIVLQHELEDAKDSKVIHGAQEFIHQAALRNLPLGIVTRNCRAASEIKLSVHSIMIDALITREDALPKPDPQALLMLADKWGLEAASIAYIGDYHYDIEAAHNADMQAWLYQHDQAKSQYKDRLSYIPKLESNA